MIKYAVYINTPEQEDLFAEWSKHPLNKSGWDYTKFAKVYNISPDFHISLQRWEVESERCHLNGIQQAAKYIRLTPTRYSEAISFLQELAIKIELEKEILK